MKFLKHLAAHVLKWNEYISIPLAILIWMLSPIFLHWVDPTASLYDAGIFQVIIFTIIQFLIYHGVVWIMIKASWPGIYHFLDDVLEEKILVNGSLTPWQKCMMVLWIFTLYFVSIIMLSRVV